MWKVPNPIDGYKKIRQIFRIHPLITPSEMCNHGVELEGLHFATGFFFGFWTNGYVAFLSFLGLELKEANF